MMTQINTGDTFVCSDGQTYRVVRSKDPEYPIIIYNGRDEEINRYNEDYFQEIIDSCDDLNSRQPIIFENKFGQAQCLFIRSYHSINHKNSEGYSTLISFPVHVPTIIAQALDDLLSIQEKGYTDKPDTLYLVLEQCWKENEAETDENENVENWLNKHLTELAAAIEYDSYMADRKLDKVKK